MVAQVFDPAAIASPAGPPRARLARALEGEVRFDAATRGRYSTDASIYQIVPQGVVLPKSVADVEAALGIAREEGASVIARGGGTSQAGQTIGQGLVIDNSSISTSSTNSTRRRAPPGSSRASSWTT